MIRSITQQEAGTSLDQIIRDLDDESVTEITGSDGSPVAMVVSPRRWNELAHARFWKTIEAIQARNADKDPDEVFADVTEIVEEVRQERYEQALRDTRAR